MNSPRFIQIHTLASYVAALLNRDDSGLAKRLPYGDALRTRISSQCLKRHWRMADDPHSLNKIDGATTAFRSRELVTRKVVDPLRDKYPDDVIDALETEFQKVIYGDKGDSKSSRQVLLFGEPEMNWLRQQAEGFANQANGVAKKAAEDAGKWRSERKGKELRNIMKAMRESTVLPAGLIGALFGRMVTSDPEANITAPIHVAHAFTVHREEPESDYFTAVDDLAEEGESGAGTIQETELTSGLFYGYVVVDLLGLLENLADDKALAGQILHNLVYLIAEVSPGAKIGFHRALWQSLVHAFGGRRPAAPEFGRSISHALRPPNQSGNKCTEPSPFSA